MPIIAFKGALSSSDDQGLGLKSWLTGPRKTKAPVEGEAERAVPFDRHRVAVLPFANMSPDPADEYFADGMTEELIMTMSKIDQFEVISRTSIMQFKKNPKPVKEVSRELAAGTVLEGSIRKSGENLRVTIQMIDPTKDRHVWAESYDRQLKDVFLIQSEISKAVAEELKVRILPDEKARLEKKPTGSAEAYALYLKGRHALNERTREGFRKAIEYFTEATRQDPSFARAYVGLSSCYGIMENWGLVRPDEAFAKMKTYTARALELDDSLGEAHTSLASILAGKEGKIAEAEQEFRRAIKLDPSSADSHQRLAFQILGPAGRHEEALSELSEAARLDPLSPIISSNIGDEYQRAGRYQDAERQYRTVLETAPRFGYAHSRLGLILLQLSRYDEALTEIQKARELASENVSVQVDLIYAYAKVGRKQDAEKLLVELEQRALRDYVSNVDLAMANASVDRNDRAFEFLQKAITERSNQLRPNINEPHFERMRTDPRFRRILEIIHMK